MEARTNPHVICSPKNIIARKVVNIGNESANREVLNAVVSLRPLI
jgi:hypothetical protein